MLTSPLTSSHVRMMHVHAMRMHAPADKDKRKRVSGGGSSYPTSFAKSHWRQESCFVAHVLRMWLQLWLQLWLLKGPTTHDIPPSPGGCSECCRATSWPGSVAAHTIRSG